MARIKIANFNLRNMILPGRKYYGDNVLSSEIYAEKINWTGAQLSRMNADLVAFEEIFDRKAVEDAVEKSGIYPQYEIIVFNDGGNRPVVGFLSRFPVVSAEEITQFPPESLMNFQHEDISYQAQISTFRHPVLKVRVKLPGNINTTVFVAHLKSKRPILLDNEDSRKELDFALGKARALIIRTAEATALRCLILREFEEGHRPIILTGDLNDAVHSVTTNIMTNEPPYRNMPSEVKQSIWKHILYSTYDLQTRSTQRDVYYTHIHNGNYESLDHILVSEDFYPGNPHHIGKVEYMRLFNDHLLDRTLTDEKPPKWVSDHGQVLVSIKLKTE